MTGIVDSLDARLYESIFLDQYSFTESHFGELEIMLYVLKNCIP